MMLARMGAAPTLFEQLQLWIKTHPRKRPEDMPAELHKLYQRLYLANTWMTKHGSKRHVVAMLLHHYRTLGEPYSDATARRDIHDAMELFGGLDRPTMKWLTQWIVDGLIERLDHCKRAGKDKEYAGLTAQLDKWMIRYERLVMGDEQAIQTPVPILAIQAPEEAGLPVPSNIGQLIADWKKKREQRLLKGGSNAVDADFTEMPE